MSSPTTRPSGRTRGAKVASTCLAAAAGIAGVTMTPAAPAAAAPPPQPTPFALNAVAYGSQVNPGDVQAGSGKTGLVVIGCTTLAGLDRTKGAETSEIGDVGQADGISTRVWTTQAGGEVTSHARSRVSSAALGNDAASVALSDLVVTTRTWHDDRGFHRRHEFRLGGLTGEVGGTPLPDLPEPDEIEPGQEVEIPGLVTLTFDVRTGKAGPVGASATSTGVVVDLVDGTTAQLARASSQIRRGVPGGVLGGRAQSAYSPEGLIEARNVVKKSVPCTGTDGEWRTARGAGFSQPGIETGDAVVGALGDQLGKGEAVARTRARTSRVSIGADAIVVTAIRSQANVVRDGRTYTRTPAGSRVGSLEVAGEEQPLPDPGESLEIPGVARITPEVIDRTERSITVVGLRIRLLEGTEVTDVYDIAKSRARIDSR